jgi:hypothetical protein
MPSQGVDREFSLGDLLVMANSLTSTQLLAVREFCLGHDKGPSEVLQELGMASEEVVDASEQMLTMIKEGVLTKDQAALLVRKLCRCTDVEQMMEILSNIDDEISQKQEVVQVLDLVGFCNLITPELLESAMEESAKVNAPLLKLIRDSGILSAHLFTCAQACKATVDSGVIELEQGLIALTYAAENETTFADALAHFGWHNQLVAAQS